jgi:hypothetical protein
MLESLISEFCRRSGYRNVGCDGGDGLSKRGFNKTIRHLEVVDKIILEVVPMDSRGPTIQFTKLEDQSFAY